MPRHDGSLTEKQKLFCKEYIKDLNASRAAVDAGTEKYSAYLDLYVRDPDKIYQEYFTDYC